MMGFDTGALLPLDKALQGMLEQLSCCCDTEQLPLPQALDRILAEEISSPLSVPPFDNAAMDGYAVRLADLAAGAPLPVAGKAFAGQPYEGEWPAGHCIRIMTGAPVPAGTEAVVMQEETQEGGNGITFLTTPFLGQNIRRRGEDMAQGSRVLASGLRLSPRELPLLASLGIATVTVRRPLMVAIFSTGDELKPLGTPLAHGDIYDSNRYGVKAMLTRMGIACLDLGIIPDDPAALRAAFIQADCEADALITTGGVSVGEADFTKQLLEELGEIGFWKLAIKPGKPLCLRSPAKRLVLRPAGQPRLRHGYLRSVGAAGAGQAGRPPLRAPTAAAGHRDRAPQEGAGATGLPTRHAEPGPERPRGTQHRLPGLRGVQLLVPGQLLHSA